MKKAFLLLLCLIAPFYAIGADNDEVWITIGSDALTAIRAEFTDREWRVFAERHLTNPDVSLMKVTEAQIPVISRLMHRMFNRCGGFMAHASYEKAIASAHYDLTSPGTSKRALTYTLDRSSEVNTVLGDLTEQGILDVITQLSSYSTRYYTSQTSVTAANWLKSEWESMASGRSDITVELYNHSWLMPSVVMTITGAHQPQDIVVMGGHLDSINQSGSSAPGADDDASGIATLTEVIRAALANGWTPARTIKFIGYAAEEVGLRGSADIAADHKNSGANVIGVMQLDMTNYNGSSQDIWLMSDYTNSAQNTFVGNLIDTYTGATRGSSSCGYGCSDHASWHNQGFAASMPFESRMGDHNPYIHTANDTLSVSNNRATHALKFARMGVAYAIELAKGGLNGNPGTDPGPVGGGGPTPDTELVNGQGVAASGDSGSQTFYYIDVPSGASNLSISTSGGSGDLDLYTRFGSKPTTSAYDCRPYESGNNESCSVPSPSTGRYYVMLHGYSSYSGANLTASYTTSNPNNPPSASFSHSTSGLTASFSDNSSDSDGSITSWSWNFGDGTSSSSQSPSHTYGSAGTYTVTLTVTDDDGASDNASASVTVTSSSNNPPSASFSHSTSDLTASFSDNSSDSDGTISSWSWTFGDGNTSTAQNPSHTYGSAGAYSVTLTVTDNDGASDSASTTVTVTDPSGDGELTNGETVSGISASSGNWVYYYIQVPAGASDLNVNMSGGSGDADLYVRYGSQPTTGSYDCRPYKNGNTESCSIGSLSAGTYHIGIRAYSTFSGLSLTVSYTEPGGGCTGDSFSETNLSGNSGTWQHFTLDAPSCATSLTVNMSGGSGDADLYVRFGSQPTTSSYDCRPYKNGNSEDCSISNPSAGTWYISIRGYSTYSGVSLSASVQ